MTISRSRHRVDWPIPPVAFNGLNVADVDTLKLLGVTFDRHLHFGQHLRTTALRAARRIGFLRKAFKVLDHKCRTAAHKGFVRPMLECCPLLWSRAADGHLRRLDKVQKRALSLLGQGTIVDSPCAPPHCQLPLLLVQAAERPPPAHTPRSASPTIGPNRKPQNEATTGNGPSVPALSPLACALQ